MKIGILTQPLHSNYGGLLQNYALQQTLIRLGHEVETIDWEGGSGLHETLYRIKIRVLHTLFPNKYPQLKYRPNKKERAIIQRNTHHFINTYINHTEAMHSYEEFVKQASKGKYDAYVVGSDQCWRPCYNAFLSSMFLDFVQDKQVKRIAYAASFGTDKWEFTPQQTAVCALLAKKFDMVSVREDSGVKLCKEHLGVDAVHVLDPTMLLTKEEYIQLIEKEKEPKSNGTLFNYILDPDAKKSVFIQKVAKAKGLKAFMGSKYVQARMATAYADAKRFLAERRKVLFSGTPCQIAGLHHFLRKPYDNLLSVDIICHGTPSPKVWGMYLDEVVTAGRKAINDVQFRNKRNGWKAFNVTMEYNKDEQSVSLCSHHQQNHFMRVFLRDMILRPSCYLCQAKSGRSHSDITIADFWGINTEMPEMDDDKGTGLVLLNSDKGQTALDWSKTNHKETTADFAIGHNPAYFRSVAAHPKRAEFFARIDETESVNALIVDCLRPTLKQRLRMSLSLCKRLIKRILGFTTGGVKQE